MNMKKPKSKLIHCYTSAFLSYLCMQGADST